jgi:hypothetical protein
MKRLILLFIILTINFSAKAECTSSGINVWPTQQNISTNSIFVIEGYAQSQELIRQLNKKNKVYLKCSSEIIPIKVLRILEGQYSLTQAILKPEKDLQIGKTYELHIDNLGMFDIDEYKVVKWTVNSEQDIEKPIWSCEPTFKNTSFTAFGCGPEMYVNFCGAFKDKSPSLIYAKVFDKKNKTSSDYFLASDNQKISLGHGMCSGEFSFNNEINYEVQFGLIDASGNENLTLTKPITFTRPTEKNQSEKEFSCNCTTNTIQNAETNNNSKILNYSLIGIGLITLGLIIYKKQKNASS